MNNSFNSKLNHRYIYKTLKTWSEIIISLNGGVIAFRRIEIKNTNKIKIKHFCF
jgi:hypothetical protein